MAAAILYSLTFLEADAGAVGWRMDC